MAPSTTANSQALAELRSLKLDAMNPEKALKFFVQFQVHKTTLGLSDDEAMKYLTDAMPTMYLAYNVQHDYVINRSFDTTFRNCQAAVRGIHDSSFLSKQRATGNISTSSKFNDKPKPKPKHTSHQQRRTETASPQTSNPTVRFDVPESLTDYFGDPETSDLEIQDTDDHDLRDSVRRVTDKEVEELDNFLMTLSPKEFQTVLDFHGVELTEAGRQRLESRHSKP
jgi:hypothetical protein